MSLDESHTLADRVLFEDSLSWAHRATAVGDRLRFQYGVLVPPAVAEPLAERSSAHAELFVEAPSDTVLHLLVRFLRLRTRYGTCLSVDERWDEGEAHEIPVSVAIGDLDGAVVVPVSLPAAIGSNGSTACSLHGEVRLDASPVATTSERRRVIVEIANRGAFNDGGASRDAALRCSFVGIHFLASLDHGRFCPPVDPSPPVGWTAVERPTDGAPPVLVGGPARDDLVLGAPILFDQRGVVGPRGDLTRDPP